MHKIHIYDTMKFIFYFIHGANCKVFHFSGIEPERINKNNQKLSENIP